MKQYLAAGLAMIAMASSAQAVSINTTFNPGSNGLPAGSTAGIVQSFTTNAANSTAFSASLVTPLVDPATGQSTTGDVRLYQGDVSGEAVGPKLGTGSFLSILSGSYTLNFAAGVQVLSFLMGGLDQYNSVTLNFANSGPVILTGDQIIGQTLTGGPNYGSFGRVTYDFGGTDSLTSVVFASSQAAFEIDDIAAAVPEPATWGMMILGFGLVGSQLRLRRRKPTAAVA